VFDDVHLVAEDGHALAVFTADENIRGALADALSWHVQRRFQTDALEAEKVLDLRAGGALADRLDEFRGVEGRSEVRLTAGNVRLLIEAASGYRSERDVDSYQSPEERDRLGVLGDLVDPLFDLLADLDRADEVLAAQSYGDRSSPWK
jgi:hypothetical protein